MARKPTKRPPKKPARLRVPKGLPFAGRYISPEDLKGLLTLTRGLKADARRKKRREAPKKLPTKTLAQVAKESFGTLQRQVRPPRDWLGESDTRYDYIARFNGNNAALRVQARLEETAEKLGVRAAFETRVQLGFAKGQATSNKPSSAAYSLNFIEAESKKYEGQFNTAFLVLQTRGFNMDAALRKLGWKLSKKRKTVKGKPPSNSKTGTKGKKGSAFRTLEALKQGSNVGQSTTSKRSAGGTSKKSIRLTKSNRSAAALSSQMGANTFFTTQRTSATSNSSVKSSPTSKKKRRRGT